MAPSFTKALSVGILSTSWIFWWSVFLCCQWAWSKLSTQSHFLFNDCVYCIFTLKLIALKTDTDYMNAWEAFFVNYLLNSRHDLKDNKLELNVIVMMES